MSVDDVVVVGAGAVGLACALALVEQGRSVRMLEAGRIGGATSSGNCGTITPSHAPPLAAPGTLWQALRWSLDPASPLYVRPGLDPARWDWLRRFALRCNRHDWLAAAAARAALLRDSRQRLEDWVARYELQCEYRPSGLDYVFADERHFAQHCRHRQVLDGLGIATEVLAAGPYLAAEPAFRPGICGAIRFPGDACLRPERYTAGLAAAARARGVLIQEQCALQSFTPESDAVQLQTSHGGYRCRELVLAGGPWTPQLARGLGLRVPITPGKGYSITCPRPSQVPSRPVVLKDHSVFVIAWEQALRLGGTMELGGYDDRLNPTRLAAIARAARRYLHDPGLEGAQQPWYGWRPMTPDDLPLLGRSPAQRRVWLAAGHGMLGISMSSGSGQLIADLICQRPAAVDPQAYRPERFT